MGWPQKVQPCFFVAWSSICEFILVSFLTQIRQVLTLDPWHPIVTKDTVQLEGYGRVRLVDWNTQAPRRLGDFWIWGVCSFGFNLFVLPTDTFCCWYVFSWCLLLVSFVVLLCQMVWKQNDGFMIKTSVFIPDWIAPCHFRSGVVQQTSWSRHFPTQHWENWKQRFAPQSPAGDVTQLGHGRWTLDLVLPTCKIWYQHHSEKTGHVSILKIRSLWIVDLVTQSLTTNCWNTKGCVARALPWRSTTGSSSATCRSFGCAERWPVAADGFIWLGKPLDWAQQLWEGAAFDPCEVYSGLKRLGSIF